MRRLVVSLVVVVALLGACGGKDKPPRDTTTGDTAVTQPGLSYYDGPPPWPLAGQQFQRIQAAGLEGYKAEALVVHYHAHLDVFYDGQPVKVPASVGIDYDAQRISPMHTHADSGVIHIEANQDATFTLGQFLSEWGVKVTGACVADKCGDEVAVFVNGSIQDTPAPGLVIHAGNEIALVLGTQPPDIPSSYDCKAEAPDTTLCPPR
ncbi:MAG: hypothetical protein QOG90_1554 [Actinomycetota bacterium]